VASGLDRRELELVRGRSPFGVHISGELMFDTTAGRPAAFVMGFLAASWWRQLSTPLPINKTAGPVAQRPLEAHTANT